MTDSLKTVTTRKGFASTPQTVKADNREVKNKSGGYVFKTDDMVQVRRFLILGAPKGFYQAGAELAKENSDVLIKVIESSPEGHRAVVDAIVEVSTQGRAPKQNPGVFALAVASAYGETEGRKYALSKLNEVARTGTTLFMFIDYVGQFRGWGRALTRAIAGWYTDKATDKLAYQTVKYRQRNGYTHRDAFRLSHPEGVDQVLGAWILGKDFDEAELPEVVQGFLKAKDAKGVTEVVSAIKQYSLSWEMIPTDYLNEVKVWEALLDSGNVPLGAMIRQLSRLTRIGVLKPLGKYTKMVTNKLGDVKEIKRARLHPINLLIARKAYALGYSVRQGATYAYGYYERDTKNTWTPVDGILGALDDAFKLAFQAVEPTGLNYLWAQDVSGSMGVQIDSSGLTAAEAGAAMSLTLLNTEPNVHVVGFQSSVVDLDISASDSPSRAAEKALKRNFGSTNPTSAIQYATKNRLEVDVFVVCTDNEVNHGNQHVWQALDEYNRKTGRQAKLVVLATSSNKFTIGDPDKPEQYLDIAGFDSAVPKLIAEFSRGF